MQGNSIIFALDPHNASAKFMVKKLFLSVFLFQIFSVAVAQEITITGKINKSESGEVVPYVNVVLLSGADSAFVKGTVTNEKGRFVFESTTPGEYLVQYSFVGFETGIEKITVGKLSEYLDLGEFVLYESAASLEEVEVTSRRDEVQKSLDKKSFNIDENISQQGGSLLQALQNLPGITTDQDGQVTLRGSNQIAILIDGKQTALTGYGRQEGLDNIPASAIERIEIINNPSAKYDATGMGGIVNIITKKEDSSGWNGKLGFTGGTGALTEKRGNLRSDMRDQYRFTPKLNPSASLNYRKKNLNFFANGDVLWRKKMMRNEFITRTYENGDVVQQQFLENRTQPIYNVKAGLDWQLNDQHELSFYTLYNYRAYNDLGDIPYVDGNTGMRRRFWEYDELEVNQTFTGSLAHTYSFEQPGHQLQTVFNYSFRRKEEDFNFINTLPNQTGTDTTSLVADEHIFDLEIDYVKPLKKGKMEWGAKQRNLRYPNQITFNPGINSVLNPGLAGRAECQENLTALYGNYIYETKKLEVEAGLRVEHADISYLVDENHAVYEDGNFDYIEPFPAVRASFKLNDRNNLSLFYNRRVDRPQEKNLRSFATYADPEILAIGNPGLIPQFTQTVEAGYKHSGDAGYFYAAGYYRFMDNLLTQIVVPFPESQNLASVNQNAGSGTNAGVELVFTQEFNDVFRMDWNANVFQNVIDDYAVANPFNQGELIDFDRRENLTGNTKLNLYFKVWQALDIQITGTYIARDVVPQGEIAARYFADLGLKLPIQKGKGELFFNASDVLNTLVIEYDLIGDGFDYISTDYLETQIFRLGYSYRF